MDAKTLLLSLDLTTCRICLQNHDSSNSLYDAVTSKPSVELRELLHRVAQVDIAPPNEEIAPSRICQTCTGKLLAAFDFISAIAKSELLLLECLRLPKKSSEEVVHDDEEEDQDLEAPDNEFVEVMYDDAPCSSRRGSSKNVDTIVDPMLDGRPTIGSRLSFYQSADWHKCPHCTRAFAKKATLLRHQAVHQQAPPEQIASKAPKPTSEQPITCGHCPRLFARKDTLQRHMRALHQSELKDNTTTTASTEATMTIKQEQNDDEVHDHGGQLTIDTATCQKTKRTYKRGLCPHCGESFSHASLIIHIRRHTGEKPYQCNTCEKGFPRRQDLIIHQRQHTGERPHVCTVCGKSFIRPNKLTRHMRIHSGQRPYKCKTCEKAFAQSNDLKIHTRRHTGEKPYKCGVCGESFICGTALNVHRKSKKHFEPEGADIVDPYANIRVNNRTRCNKIEI